MGCGSSKGVIVPSDSNRITDSTLSVKETSKKKFTAKDSLLSSNETSPGVCATEIDSAKRREISASSTRTADSGISEPLPETEDNIITEHSNENRLIQVHASQRPDTPDLVLEGVACPRKQSGKERRLLELQKKSSESNVPKLPPLTNNSLLERPKTRGGMAFDITFIPETGNMKKSANLPKLERRRKKKKLTKEELEEKMKKAAERRQAHNKKIAEKSHAFAQQYEDVLQRRQNAEALNDKNEENLDFTKDNVTDIVKLSENEHTDIQQQ